MERSIHKEVVDRLILHAKKTQPGNPLNPDSKMGAIVSNEQTMRINHYIEKGKKDCELLIGGKQVHIKNSGCFIQPTIFNNVEPNHVIATDEIFGPVLSIIPFDSEDEAINIANNSIYGLAASVWTSNLSRAHRVSQRLRVGTVSVNTVDALSIMTPFGGFKQSGFGRDLSLHALDKFTGLKTTWIKYKP